MNIDRIQGLLDLVSGGKINRNAALTMADYWVAQKELGGQALELLAEGLAAQEASGVPVSISGLLSKASAAAEQAEALAGQLAARITDAEALSLRVEWPQLQVGRFYAGGAIGWFDGVLYRVAADKGVTVQAHQLPGGAGMGAVYRPVAVGQKGTLEDPIDFMVDMDVEEGLYYRYEGNVYFAQADMMPCHAGWTPGAADMWQWEKV